MGALFAGEPNAEVNPEAIRLVEAILRNNPVMRHELNRQFRISMKLRHPSLSDVTFLEFVGWDYSLLSVSSISRATLWEMVAVAANIQRLACACLTTLLKCQLRRIIMKGTVPWDVGAFSWNEEYSVHRGLSHLQLYSDPLVANERLNWPLSDLEYVRKNDTAWDHLRATVSAVMPRRDVKSSAPKHARQHYPAHYSVARCIST